MHRKCSIINSCSGILTYKLSFFLLFLSSIQLIAKDVTIFGSAEDYTTYPLESAVIHTIPVLAEDFTIPESWQLLATAQDGEISEWTQGGAICCPRYRDKTGSHLWRSRWEQTSQRVSLCP